MPGMCPGPLSLPACLVSERLYLLCRCYLAVLHFCLSVFLLQMSLWPSWGCRGAFSELGHSLAAVSDTVSLTLHSFRRGRSPSSGEELPGPVRAEWGVGCGCGLEVLPLGRSRRLGIRWPWQCLSSTSVVVVTGDVRCALWHRRARAWVWVCVTRAGYWEGCELGSSRGCRMEKRHLCLCFFSLQRAGTRNQGWR